MLQSQLDRIAEEGREAAERRVREAFLLEAVAKAESIEATDEDIDQRLGEMAEARRMPPEQLRKIAHDQGWYEAMRSEFVDQKALDLLIERAEVEEVETDEREVPRTRTANPSVGSTGGRWTVWPSRATAADSSAACISITTRWWIARALPAMGSPRARLYPAMAR